MKSPWEIPTLVGLRPTGLYVIIALMDIKELITTTLTDIDEALKSAEAKTELSYELIIPDAMTGIEFDLAVMSTEQTDKETGKKAAFKLSVASADIGSKNSASDLYQVTSRIKFTVYPH